MAAPIPREPPVTRATRIGEELVSIFILMKQRRRVSIYGYICP
jgi:hypothetical protein